MKLVLQPEEEHCVKKMCYKIKQLINHELSFNNDYYIGLENTNFYLGFCYG